MKHPCKKLLEGTIAVLTLFLGSFVSATPSIELKTDPPLDKTVPFSEPTTFSLTALDDQGQPLETAQFDLTLSTPPKTPWWTSDFPIVEGTKLMELELLAEGGIAQFQKTMPIRGNYALQVTIYPQIPGDFERYTEVLTFNVPENPLKYRNVAILLSVLFLVGLGGGWIIGGKQTVIPGETAPRRVQWLLSIVALVLIGVMAYISITAEQADAHSQGHDNELALEEELKAKPIPANITAVIEEQVLAVVGEVVPLSINVTDVNGNPIENANLTVEARSVEYNRSILKFKARSNSQGQFTWQQQFFDGSPHQIIVNVVPNPESNIQFPPFALAKTIEVEGIAPPLLTRLISLSYFTLVLALGTGTGFLLKSGSGINLLKDR